ncbi:Phospholipase A1-II 1 [Seminavis robusta]|uniref:Phospholipase A1-II 1 n=1 Tax=Seminavis robusta TaxID=568900 RepID=A0A9N8HMP2_9STRA|nr:Phospholipase A1-II 1 [Seminavis robusta]|eukprot:Sro920_g220310.1 Phospholipase A1-II 1 (590) ;mRNA; f:34990-37016
MPFGTGPSNGDQAKKGGAKAALLGQIEEFQDVEHGDGTVQQMSLYAEARRMLAAAYLMFVLPDMRTLMRNGEQLQGDPEMLQRVLACPCTALDVATIFNANMTRMQELVKDDERATMYNQSMDLNHPDLPDIQLLVMDDEKGDQECVYSLSVNHPKKLVSVLFRGSVTTKDFVQDSKVLLTQIDNPMGVAPKLLGLHMGFKEYLYEELPWHEYLIPSLVKEGLSQTAHVAKDGVQMVGKGVKTAGTTAVDVTKKGVTAVGTVAMTGVHALASGVGTVTDMVGVTHHHQQQQQGNETKAANNDNTPNDNDEETGNNRPTGTQQKETIEVDLQGSVTHQQPREQPNTSNSTTTNKPARGKKYEIIMDQVKQVFADYPHYRLYIGGHSLGGALATIFAFECAATTSGITKPVTCITSGAPKVGNLQFLKAFESLEEKNWLRCIHVANYRDIVTQSPALPMCCCYGSHFRRAGFHLTLSPHAYILSYPARLGLVGRFCLDIVKWIKHVCYVLLFVPLLFLCGCQTKKFLREEHTQLKYMNRFDNQKAALQHMTLDELYRERFGATAKKHLRAGVVKTTKEDQGTTAAMEVGNL